MLSARQAIQLLEWSIKNDSQLISKKILRKQSPAYVANVRDDMRRKETVVTSWRNRQELADGWGVWARYYYWWASLIEYAYKPDMLKYERYESTKTNNFFTHMAKQLRDARDDELKDMRL